MGTKGNFLLRLSHGQIKHHLRHGGGIWDSLKKVASKAWEVAKPALKEHAHKAVEKIAEHITPRVDAALAKFAGAAGHHIGHKNAAELAKFFSKAAHSGIGKATSKAHEKLAEHGLGLTSAGGRGVGKPKRKYTKRKTKGGAVAGIEKPWPVRQGAS